MNEMRNYTRKDFVALIEVNNANPNGDPYYNNNPRTYATTYMADSNGVMSPVCLKRKIRNRIQDSGMLIFNQSTERKEDDCDALAERFERCKLEYLESVKDASVSFNEYILDKYIDIRMFGDCFAYKESAKTKKVAHSDVRGAVTINEAYSVAPVEIVEQSITRSVNGQPPKKKDADSDGDNANGRSSDTMGERKFVRHGLYVMRGSVNAQFAEKNRFTESDYDALKESIRTMFVNDESAARPAGSMRVVTLYWFDHDCKDGQYNPMTVHDSIKITVKEGVDAPTSFADYDVVIEHLDGLEPEVIKGW